MLWVYLIYNYLWQGLARYETCMIYFIIFFMKYVKAYREEKKKEKFYIPK